jgi:hypothetical protein
MPLSTNFDAASQACPSAVRLIAANSGCGHRRHAPAAPPASLSNDAIATGSSLSSSRRQNRSDSMWLLRGCTSSLVHRGRRDGIAYQIFDGLRVPEGAVAIHTIPPRPPPQLMCVASLQEHVAFGAVTCRAKVASHGQALWRPVEPKLESRSDPYARPFARCVYGIF